MGKTDPYVLVNLLGGNVKECKTKVVKNNSNPVWEESIRFMANEAYGRVLLLQVFDKDLMRDDPMGEVNMQITMNDNNNINFKIRVPITAEGCRQEWRLLEKYSGKVSTGSPSKRQSSQSRQRSSSRSSSEERRKVKSPPGAPSIKYQLSYTGNVLNVNILECKVGYCGYVKRMRKYINVLSPELEEDRLNGRSSRRSGGGLPSPRDKQTGEDESHQEHHRPNLQRKLSVPGQSSAV